MSRNEPKRGTGTVAGYTYHFGTAAIRHWVKTTGKPQGELVGLLIQAKDQDEAQLDPLVLSEILHSGLVRQHPELTLDDVDDIVDELTGEQVGQVLIDLMKSLLPPEGLKIMEAELETAKKKIQRVMTNPTQTGTG